MKLIGEKENFGVQLNIVDCENLMGYAKIWFGGNSIGTEEDLIFMSYLISGLKEIANSKEINLKSKNNTVELFNTLSLRLKNINDNEIYQYLVTFGTFCDDFTIFSFLYEKEINIIWKLNSNRTPFKDLNLQDTDVRGFKLKKNHYIKTLNEIIEFLEKSGKKS